MTDTYALSYLFFEIRRFRNPIVLPEEVLLYKLLLWDVCIVKKAEDPKNTIAKVVFVITTLQSELIKKWSN